MQKLEDNISFPEKNKLRNKMDSGGMKGAEKGKDTVDNIAVTADDKFALLWGRAGRVVSGKQKCTADGGNERRDPV